MPMPRKRIRKTKGEELADKRKYFKGKKRRLSPKEHGEAISRGKRAAKEGRMSKPRDTIKVGGQERYAVRRRDGTFRDIQDPKLARSRDRIKSRQRTGSDRR